MFCTNCGKQNPDTGRFCIECGTPLSQPVKQPVPELPVVEQEPVIQIPVVEEPVPEPVVEEPIPEPVVEEPAPVPVVEEPVAQPIIVEAPPAQAVYQPVCPPQPVQTQPPMPPKKKKKVWKTLLILVAILIPVAVVAVIGVGHVCDFLAINQVQPIIDDYFKTTFNLDAKGYIELFPEDAVEYQLEEGWYDDEDDFEESVREELEWSRPFEGNIEYTYEILGVRELEEDSIELEELKDGCKENYGVRISGAMQAWIWYEVEGEGEDEVQYRSGEIVLVQEGDDWYLHPRYL